VISTSTSSLHDLVDGITNENSGGNASAPPRIASISPFYEVLVRDISATLPPELANLMASTSSMSELMDWVAAGAMLRWLDDSYSREVYLENLQQNPQRASLSLAKVMASRMEPPRRAPEWCRLDLSGLILQIALTVVILCCRGLLMAILAFWLSGWPPDWLAFIPAGIVDLPYLLSVGRADVASALASLIAAAWHAFEIRWAPHLIEGARQLPFRLRGMPAPIPWRLDTFRAIWLLQSLILWLLVGLSIAREVLSPPTGVVTVRMSFAMTFGLYLFSAIKLLPGLASQIRVLNNTVMEKNGR